MRTLVASTLCCFLVSASFAVPALAQPVPPPGNIGAVPAPPAYDDEATFQRGMDAFTAGRYQEAADAFDEVAAQSPDAGRRGAAAALATQARSRVGVAVTPPAPPAGGLDIPPAPNTTALPFPPAAPDTERPPEEPVTTVDQGPRMTLLTGSTLLGLSLYGAGVPAAFGLFSGSDDDSRLAVGTYLLVAASSFFIPYFLTGNTPPTWGQTTAALHGAYNGAWHGALFYWLAGADFDNGESLLGAMVLTSLLEGIGGYALAGYTDMTAGEAHALEAGTALGAGLFAGMTLVIGGEDTDPDVLAWMSVLGLVGGGVGGRLIAEAETFSWGDVWAIQTGAGLGLGAMATLAVDMELDSTRGIAGMLVLGGIGGAVLTERLLVGYDLLNWQALALSAVTYLGGAAGAGIAFVLGSNDEKLIVSVGALAAAAGFGITLYAFDLPAEDPDAADGDAPHTSEAPADFSLAPWFDGRGGRGLALNGRF